MKVKKHCKPTLPKPYDLDAWCCAEMLGDETLMDEFFFMEGMKMLPNQIIESYDDDKSAEWYFLQMRLREGGIWSLRYVREKFVKPSIGSEPIQVLCTPALHISENANPYVCMRNMLEWVVANFPSLIVTEDGKQWLYYGTVA